MMVNSKVIFPLATLLFTFHTSIIRAQIIPDNTLGNESSVVTELENKIEQISGGATRGNNLFHSFLEFSIGEGASAYFASPEEIVNIFSRVTGNNISEILGTLGVNGNANLFLINPNGIMFGSNSSLDISGSFVATSASGIMFDNGTEFSATNPQAPPLLTVTTTQPIGLRFEGQPGRVMGNIANWGVPKRETLALVGVDLEGVSLSAPGGRIELGGLNQSGVVGLNQDFSLSFPEGVERSNITLSNGTFVDVSSDGGGEISINAANLDISGRSVILAVIAEDVNAPQAVAGDIEINAIENINIDTSFIFNCVLGVGNVNLQCIMLDRPKLTENITFLKACSRGRRGKIELFDVGSGGLPFQPEDPLRGTTIIAPWIPLTFDSQPQETSIELIKPELRKPSPSATTAYTIFVGYSCQQ